MEKECVMLRRWLNRIHTNKYQQVIMLLHIILVLRNIIGHAGDLLAALLQIAVALYLNLINLLGVNAAVVKYSCCV
jgi:hypothetical protein